MDDVRLVGAGVNLMDVDVNNVVIRLWRVCIWWMSEGKEMGRKRMS